MSDKTKSSDNPESVEVDVLTLPLFSDTKFQRKCHFCGKPLPHNPKDKRECEAIQAEM